MTKPDQDQDVRQEASVFDVASAKQRCWDSGHEFSYIPLRCVTEGCTNWLARGDSAVTQERVESAVAASSVDEGVDL